LHFLFSYLKMDFFFLCLSSLGLFLLIVASFVLRKVSKVHVNDIEEFLRNLIQH
jgi:hypothetical protein